SLEQMLAANPGKTPISLLQEYGTRIGKTPGYDLLKAEGQAHQPNFTFRVTVGDISCTGGSPTSSPVPPGCPLPSPHPTPARPRRGGGGEGRGQPGEGPIFPPSPPSPGSAPCWGAPPGCQGGFPGLAHPVPPPVPPQELVVQKGWRLPEYTVTQESGPAHRKEFTMTCRVERFVEIGSGTSKKLAKRNAAAKMLVRIHNVPMEPREGSEAELEEEQFSM
ncbi:TRBP2 protein, partial [Brachypteracias leptosomus]|nr:TRBP2 protein [Brachypteracias leptosomus]